jgi:hypothetical protein
MDLSFTHFDGRSWNIIDVIDKDTGRVVGFLRPRSSSLSGIEISLFEDKYRAVVGTSDECLGFVRGVQAVLNHIAWSSFDAQPHQPVERRI